MFTNFKKCLQVSKCSQIQKYVWAFKIFTTLKKLFASLEKCSQISNCNLEFKTNVHNFKKTAQIQKKSQSQNIFSNWKNVCEFKECSWISNQRLSNSKKYRDFWKITLNFKNCCKFRNCSRILKKVLKFGNYIREFKNWSHFTIIIHEFKKRLWFWKMSTKLKGRKEGKEKKKKGKFV